MGDGGAMNHIEIAKLAKKANIANYGLGWTCWEGQLERFAALVVAAEREACAQMVDHILKEGGGTYGDAIRARRQA